MGVLVIVEDLKLKVAPVGHDDDRWLPDQLIGRDADSGVHATVGSLLGLTKTSEGGHSPQCRLVLPVQPQRTHPSGQLYSVRYHRLHLLLSAITVMISFPSLVLEENSEVE